MLCNSKAQWNVDLTAQYQWTEKVQVFADLLNVFDIKPKFDPSAAYGLYEFNPSWAGLFFVRQTWCVMVDRHCIK